MPGTKDKILLIGGGHCKSCIDVIEQENKYRIAGIVDMPEKKGQSILGYPVLGCNDELPELIQSPPAYISPHAQIADGTIIMHHALLNHRRSRRQPQWQLGCGPADGGCRSRSRSRG